MSSMKSRLVPRTLAITAALALTLLAAGIGIWRVTHQSPTAGDDADVPIRPQPSAGAEPIVPLPASVPVDPARARLGERLFADVRLSKDRARSCLSCHPLEPGGMDGRARAASTDGKSLLRNTPAIYNLAFDLFYNWDGATETLPQHDLKVLKNPALMGIEDVELLARLRLDPAYVTAFDAAYGTGLTLDSVLDALASYERSLVAPDSRFDRYLRGDSKALTADELRGYQLFRSLGCVACHQGQNIGGNLLQRFGVFIDTSAMRRPGDPIDWGRYNVTGRELDRQVFRVPSLRNVCVTAPYFHDGRAPTLQVAVETMILAQLGRQVPERDMQSLQAFLCTLTGRFQGRELGGPP
jgi:cytochrome c peroxidase